MLEFVSLALLAFISVVHVVANSTVSAIFASLWLKLIWRFVMCFALTELG